jgi:hypothetical protein
VNAKCRRLHKDDIEVPGVLNVIGHHWRTVRIQ